MPRHAAAAKKAPPKDHTPDPRYAAFLRELEELSTRHGLYLDAWAEYADSSFFGIQELAPGRIVQYVQALGHYHTCGEVSVVTPERPPEVVLPSGWAWEWQQAHYPWFAVMRAAELTIASSSLVVRAMAWLDDTGAFNVRGTYEVTRELVVAVHQRNGVEFASEGGA